MVDPEFRAGRGEDVILVGTFHVFLPMDIMRPMGFKFPLFSSVNSCSYL